MPRIIPIFPLEVVLLPGAPLPLHIFEPRYKEMIGECLERKTVFGVVRAKEKEIAAIGCTAEILEVTKKYPDGRLDILTLGQERFEIQEVLHDRAFLQADISLLPDTLEQPSAEDIFRLLELYKQLLTAAGVQGEIPANRTQLSFFIAGSLPLELDFKQGLLGTASEEERTGVLISYLEELLPNLRRNVQAHKTAGGNGHVH
ncbi:MAG: LON peptidase substrate-binding domain-containing protein [Acidobacteria bacterium]|jgi:Lon protease-like protein|nr:LON peptidase substrate-binding domain-containing protein [Acidobacteriota bacterium]